jgi:uncharacterized protein
VQMERGGWRVRVETRTVLTATADQFVVTNDVDAWEGEVRVHASSRAHAVPRDLV